MSENFPPLQSGDNRPVMWDCALDRAEGENTPTNTIRILLEPNIDFDESGEYPGKQFSSVTITRSELKKMLEFLERDIELQRKYCPEHEFL